MERKKASDFPQELLSLFDEYVHGHISRRSFLDRAQKFAVGGVTATALFEMLRPNYAWAVQVEKNDNRIQADSVTVPTPKGNGSINGYLVRPANTIDKLPVVLVIHENRGLNPYIEDVARRLAIANFIAFAPDGLTSVGGYPGDDEKGAELFKKVDGGKMLQDFLGAAVWLKSRPDSTGKLGAVGFCFGGGVVNQLAVRMGTELAAAVPFYGVQPSAEDTAKIKAPLLAHYGELDKMVNSTSGLLQDGPRLRRRLPRHMFRTKALCISAPITASTTTRQPATMKRQQNWLGIALLFRLRYDPVVRNAGTLRRADAVASRRCRRARPGRGSWRSSRFRPAPCRSGCPWSSCRRSLFSRWLILRPGFWPLFFLFYFWCCTSAGNRLDKY